MANIATKRGKRTSKHSDAAVRGPDKPRSPGGDPGRPRTPAPEGPFVGRVAETERCGLCDRLCRNGYGPQRRLRLCLRCWGIVTGILEHEKRETAIATPPGAQVPLWFGVVSNLDGARVVWLEIGETMLRCEWLHLGSAPADRPYGAAVDVAGHALGVLEAFCRALHGGAS